MTVGARSNFFSSCSLHDEEANGQESCICQHARRKVRCEESMGLNIWSNNTYSVQFIRGLINNVSKALPKKTIVTKSYQNKIHSLTHLIKKRQYQWSHSHVITQHAARGNLVFSALTKVSSTWSLQEPSTFLTEPQLIPTVGHYLFKK